MFDYKPSDTCMFCREYINNLKSIRHNIITSNNFENAVTNIRSIPKSMNRPFSSNS